MHPWDAEWFEWDEANEKELARHGIRPWEVEEVLEEGPRWVPNKSNARGDWKMVGRTRGGRPLTVVVALRQRTRALRAITGWTPNRAEKAKYFDKS